MAADEQKGLAEAQKRLGKSVARRHKSRDEDEPSRSFMGKKNAEKRGDSWRIFVFAVFVNDVDFSLGK